MFELRTVGGEEAEIAHNIIVECGQDMVWMGYNHWLDPYPLDHFCEDAERGNVYALLLRGSMLATISIFTQAPDDADNAIWRDDRTPAVYVARLAVRPAYQNRGHGRFLMHFAEVSARTLGHELVRLYAVATYPPIRLFYDHLGYVARGSYRLFDFEMVAFEKQVTAVNHI